MEIGWVSDFDREGRATWAAVFSLWVLQHLKGRTDELLTEVNSGSFDKLQTVWVNYYPDTIFFKHSGTKRPKARGQQKFIITVLQNIHTGFLLYELVMGAFKPLLKSFANHLLWTSGSECISTSKVTWFQ